MRVAARAGVDAAACTCAARRRADECFRVRRAARTAGTSTAGAGGGQRVVHRDSGVTEQSRDGARLGVRARNAGRLPALRSALNDCFQPSRRTAQGHSEPVGGSALRSLTRLRLAARGRAGYWRGQSSSGALAHSRSSCRDAVRPWQAATEDGQGRRVAAAAKSRRSGGRSPTRGT